MKAKGTARCADVVRPKYDRDGVLIAAERPCKNWARPGRDHCLAHEKDQEYKSAVKDQRQAEEQERKRQRERRRVTDLATWNKWCELRNLELSKLMIIPINSHQCQSNGHTVSWHEPDGWQSLELYDLPELVVCDLALGHHGDHFHLASEGHESVNWRP